jgi:hypothetical protein
MKCPISLEECPHLYCGDEGIPLDVVISCKTSGRFKTLRSRREFGADGLPRTESASTATIPMYERCGGV